MKVTFDNVYNAFQIIAPKGTMISFTGEPTALADGVYLVGDDGIINLDEQFLTDTLYLSTEGTDYAVTGGMRVTYPLGDETVIIRAGSSTIPFSKGVKGGGGSSGGCNYKGTTTTPISNGSTTNPITIDGESYTAVFGDIAVYNYTEFVFDGSAWSEFGRPFDTTPTSGSANAVTSDGIYKNTAGKKHYSNNTLKGEIFNDYTNNKAPGQCSHAEGWYTTAGGDYSHVEGYATGATNSYSHAEGKSAVARAMCSHAEGNETTASGDGSHAEGKSAVASGNASHAEGWGTTASGNASHAEGYSTKASGAYSHASGYNTSANQIYMTSIGKFNASRTGDLFNIGNGTANNARSNIVEVNSTELNVNGDIKKNNVSLPTPYTTMPTVTASMLGQIAMYVGETTNDYVKGYFYIASSDGAAEPTYSWVSMVDSTPTSGSKNYVTSGGIYNLLRKGATQSSVSIGSTSNQSTGAAAVSMGYYTKASNNNMVAMGVYNNPKAGHLLTVGNGTDSSHRKNILEVSYSELNVNGDIQRNGVGIDDYTTTERKIGKWIDGSDLYQRTFEVTASRVDGWNDNVLGTSGIKIVDVQGFMYGWYEDAYLSKPLVYYRSTTDYITVLYDDDVNVYIIDPGVSTSPMPTLTITIKYTKTSEQSLNQSYQIPSDNPFNISVTEASETPTVEEDDMR